MTESVVTSSGRVLLFRSIETVFLTPIEVPFITLAPAYSDEELSQIESVTLALAQLGCNEFCCIGPKAFSLEDLLDDILEENDRFAVTTADSDVSAGIDYFLYSSQWGESPILLALVDSHPELVVALQTAAQQRVLGEEDK